MLGEDVVHKEERVKLTRLNGEHGELTRVLVRQVYEKIGQFVTQPLLSSAGRAGDCCVNSYP